MKPTFFPVYPGRSDGALVTVQGKKKTQEPNRPTDAQLQPAVVNGAYSFYKELKVNDAKHIDWRRKLAGLLVKEWHRTMKETGILPESGPCSEANISPEDYMLAAFPENYRLFEHRRAKELDESQPRGPQDRRDVYLYGHPGGRKKRFRSPADFFPHLMWLMTTKETNHETCSCKLCTPDEILKTAEEMLRLQDTMDSDSQEKKPQNETVPSQPPPSAPEPQAKVPTPKTVAAHPKPPVAVQVKPPTAQISPSVSTQPPAQAKVPVPAPLVPTPLTRPTNTAQQHDQTPGSFIYRVGELAWYLSPEGNLSLAAIVSRSSYQLPDGKQKSAYLLQPISQPFNYQPGTITTQEAKLRPWLAFSTPGYRIPDAGDDNVTYDEVDWDVLRARNFSDQELLHDGSIRAAKMVDSTYTLVEKLQMQANAGETEFNGIYIGGEFVWRGEAVRLQTRDDCKDIMIVSRIIETSPTEADKLGSVDFVGDIYSPAVVTHNPSRPMPQNTFLPLRVREDLKYRNHYRVGHKTVFNWKFVEGQKRLSISKVKGRWYEAKAILSTLDSETFTSYISSGEIPDGADNFNGRGPSQSGEAGVKITERIQAFSRSIPTGIQLGMPFRIPTQQTTMLVNLGASQEGMGLQGPSMSNFVNMDSMEVDRNFIN